MRNGCIPGEKMGAGGYVLQVAADRADVSPRTHGVPSLSIGTPSAYMVVCLDMSVDQDVDVVFSEYIL